METFKGQCFNCHSIGCFNNCPVWTALVQTIPAEVSICAELRVFTSGLTGR